MTNKVRRNDGEAAAAWLAGHRKVAGALAVAAFACMLMLLTVPSPAKRWIGVPVFAGIGFYLAGKALGRSERRAAPPTGRP